MVKHYHLIGIGGIGMSGIARLLLSRGVKVSGSDAKKSRITEELKHLGAKIFIGHQPANIDGAELVVYSSAIKKDNPEIKQALALGVPLIKRAQALAGLMEDKTVITVAGSHGKTTTTSLVSYLLLEAGQFPTMAIGGILKNIDSNASCGAGRFFVAEADESDGSFLYYRPKYSIVTNIDHEHLDYFKTFQNAVNSFREFLHKTEEGGCLFCCDDDSQLRQLLKGYKDRYILFGLRDSADIYPKNIEINGLSSTFDCFYKDKFICRFHLALGGLHNISNSLAVIALGRELGIDLEIIKRALKNYQGSQRRLEVKFKNEQYLLIDDYAHHPTEIRATLSAIKELHPKRIIAVFQPHRYSRTKLLFEEFIRSFDLADYLIITDIYPASEPPLPGVSAGSLCDKIKQHAPEKDVKFFPKDNIVEAVMGILKPGDLVVTLGAGDIIRNCDELVERFKRQG
ncbi:UDP-N-acetylmuramate--L-alanine ligase [bacterium]|nr:MAG: UDP-N-acetylmuramate--L-alanine ligase [bacterium]